MADQDRNGPFSMLAGLVDRSVREHDTAHAQAEDSYLSAMRWLDSLDAEGLMALRWILMSPADEAHSNNRFFDGQVVQLLRAKGVDPRNGKPFAAQLLPDAP